MAKITFRPAAEVDRQAGKDVVPEHRKADYTESELEGVGGTYFPFTDESLELVEISFPAGTLVKQHAHSSAEIIYIKEGEIHVGKRVCPAGTAIYVNEFVLYSFRAGPEGVTFLNFRGKPRPAFLTKERFNAWRAEQKTAKVASSKATER